MPNLNKIWLLVLLFLSASAAARPYIGGTFDGEIGEYDRPDIKLIVEKASNVCINMFKGDFIVEHWLYKPDQDEIYLTGRTHGWLFPKKADCSYRPSNQSAAGDKYPEGLNMLGERESFKTSN